MNEEGGSGQTLFDETLLGRSLGLQDAATLANFYELFLQQARPLLESMQPGAAMRDLQGLEKLAHKLKSSSHSVGAQPLGETLAQLETLCRAGNLDAVVRLLPSAHLLASRTLAAIADLQIRLSAAARHSPAQD